ncbi:Sporulation initiation phospho-transferase B, C-terminal [Paenibacillus sp. yr247]|nr:Sporulation initiation phospho-transferase B, C-terminal [Paenibacillus sp. yr247]
MKRVGSAQVYLLALVLIGLTGMMFVEPWIVRGALLLIIVFCGYTAFKLEASRIEEKWSQELRQQEHQAQTKLIRVINRLRHDWMNDTQILFGYIQLKKFDNLHPYMEKIKMNMQQESNLSKLGIPSLIAFLLQFRVESKSLELDVELEQEINLGQLPLQGGLIERLVRQTVECVQEYAAVGDDESGTLSLEFDVQEDGLLLDFVYQGPYHREQLEKVVKENLHSNVNSYSLEHNDWQEEEAVITLRLPFHI